MSTAGLGTVLLTRGTGFLGSHIIQQLLTGNRVETIICASPNPKVELQPGDSRVVHYALDITSPSSIEALFKTMKPTTIFHTVSPPPRSYVSVLDATNVTGTGNILKAAKECLETKFFIFTPLDSVCHLLYSHKSPKRSVDYTLQPTPLITMRTLRVFLTPPYLLQTLQGSEQRPCDPHPSRVRVT